MSNIYDAMVFAMGGYRSYDVSKSPKHFELTQDAFDALTEERKAILPASKYALQQGWEYVFHRTPLVIVDGPECFIIDHNGVRSSLGAGSGLDYEMNDNLRRITD